MKDNNIFKKLHTPKELDQRIFDSTIYRKKENKKFKLRYVTVGLILMLFISVGVLAAEYIKPSFVKKINNNNGTSKIVISVDESVTLPENADLVCSDKMTLKNVENQLGLKLLNFEKYKNSIKFDNCKVLKDENNNVRTVDIYSHDNQIYDYIMDQVNDTQNHANKKYFDFGIKFKTNNATKEDIKEFNNIVLFSEVDNVNLDKLKNKTETYHIKSLNTDAIIIGNMGYFIYENVLYYYSTINYSKEETIDVLENLK